MLRGSKGCGSLRHDHLFRRGLDRFVAAPACSQNGRLRPYQCVCAFQYAVILLQLSLECCEWCLQQRQDFSSLVSRRLPWRQLIFNSSSPQWNLPDLGWHCSYCFSVDCIILILLSFEHTDLNWAPFNEPYYISHHTQHGMDLFDRENHEFTSRDAQDRLPRALTEYPDRFWPLFLPGNAAR